jgi:hypothetical protein
MENIFSTLYKYKPQPNMTPTENFFTESFKFVLNIDESLCNIFIKKIAPDKKFIGPYNIESQKNYGDSIIDLHITDRKGQKILIEIKVSAKENRYLEEDEKNDYGQIEKYLRLNKGYVCFIAREEGNVEIKNNKDKYLGQFEWFEIYQLISDYIKSHKLNSIKKNLINNFLNFMEDLDMQSFAGFDKQDTKLSQIDCFAFVSKLVAFLQQTTKDKRIKNFLKKCKLEIAYNTPKFYEKYGQVILTFKKKNWRSQSIEFGFIFDSGEDKKKGLYYYQGIMVPDKYTRSFKDLKINKKYFSRSEETGWLIEKNIAFNYFIKDGKVDKAINYIYKSLLELEKSGIIAELDKIKI